MLGGRQSKIILPFDCNYNNLNCTYQRSSYCYIAAYYLSESVAVKTLLIFYNDDALLSSINPANQESAQKYCRNNIFLHAMYIYTSFIYIYLSIYNIYVCFVHITYIYPVQIVVIALKM